MLKKPYSLSCGSIKTIHSWIKTLCTFKLAWFRLSLLTFYTLSGRVGRWTCSHFGFRTASKRGKKKDYVFIGGYEAVMLNPPLHKLGSWKKPSRIHCWHMYITLEALYISISTLPLCKAKFCLIYCGQPGDKPKWRDKVNFSFHYLFDDKNSVGYIKVIYHPY